ncbi:MAG: hypothetical protein QOI76_3585 [Frankiales bacterium]|nr:hypothetical protein [Frankiales bacterium]
MLVAILVAVFVIISGGGSGKPSALGPEGIAIETGTPLADLSKGATGQTIDGIECGATEQLAYHIHSHLAVYVDGVLRPIPLGIGIVGLQVRQAQGFPFGGATTCYYWLHTHAQDGVLHVESPTSKLYPLKDVFDIWGQPLSASQVGPAAGKVTAYVNGKLFTGDPTTITLQSREAIQLDVGKDVAPVPVDWSTSQL